VYERERDEGLERVTEEGSEREREREVGESGCVRESGKEREGEEEREIEREVMVERERGSEGDRVWGEREREKWKRK
jgi:hypothetical protein